MTGPAILLIAIAVYAAIVIVFVKMVIAIVRNAE